ncbi:phosphocholine-specific phospholipase C [Nocardia brasiliensis]|nr:phospholipase C, phosphocholine-specific [Nocardia brasiliensis]OCF84970.1 phospholipase C, phosphocholine-specific [Nocardia brasiliensis]
MSQSDSGFPRRRFLGGTLGAAALAGGLQAFPPGMMEALAAPNRKGVIGDVEHVVILMQENRSFDHYFGTMRGVRGLGDASVVAGPDGRDIYHQPDAGRPDGGYLLPFHVDTKVVDGQDLGDLPHGWDDQHRAVRGGWSDGWIAAKGEMAMSYFTADDIPFHRALADAYTVCDHYYCSVLGPTTPNRLYHWTGTIDPAGQNGGPAISNPADYRPVYRWTTYPERLLDKGISWKVYANDEVGDDSGHPFVGDYGDNPLWLFDAYHDPNKAELASRAKVFGAQNWKPDSGQGKNVEHVLADFLADCKANRLPQVSWVVAPYGYSEHPAARPVDGAAYTSAVLKALWANQTLWNSTAVLINFDENDGFFDHVPPPMAPPGTPGEYVNGAPIGLGPRVPMLVISPWSRGGWVNSQVYDHTSVIRFLEKWTGVNEPNISAWRRSICGDLTGCFDFGKTDTTIPMLPDTTALRAQADATQRTLPAPAPPPAGGQRPPAQESGTRPARPLPYAPAVNGTLTPEGALVTAFRNTGIADLQLAAYRADGRTDGPWRYDVKAGTTVTDTWNVPAYPDKKYGVAVHGPNRFLWRLAGTSTSPLEVSAAYTPDYKLQLSMTNKGKTAATVTVRANSYRTDGPWTYQLAPGKTVVDTWNALSYGKGWYDLSLTVDVDPAFQRHFRGHIENGQPSVTG